MAIGQADSSTSLEPIVILGMLNSMAVIVANVETLLGNWKALCDDGEAAKAMLERIDAHAQVVTDALELAVREIPPALLELMGRPEFE